MAFLDGESPDRIGQTNAEYALVILRGRRAGHASDRLGHPHRRRRAPLRCGPPTCPRSADEPEVPPEPDARRTGRPAEPDGGRRADDGRTGSGLPGRAPACPGSDQAAWYCGRPALPMPPGGGRAASLDPDPGRAERGASAVLPGAAVDPGARPAVGEPCGFGSATGVPPTSRWSAPSSRPAPRRPGRMRCER